MIFNKIKYLNNNKFSYLILFSFLNFKLFKIFLDTYNLDGIFQNYQNIFMIKNIILILDFSNKK